MYGMTAELKYIDEAFSGYNMEAPPAKNAISYVWSLAVRIGSFPVRPVEPIPHLGAKKSNCLTDWYS